MSDAPEQIYTNKNGTVIITPPAIPLQETDIAWCRAERIKELEAELANAMRVVEAYVFGWPRREEVCERLNLTEAQHKNLSSNLDP